MGHADAYDAYMKENAPDQRAEYERLKAIYETPQTPTQAEDTQPQERQEKGTQEAPKDAFSHYLTLADNTTVRYDVGDKPYDPFPSEWNGVPVVTVRNAMAPGKES